MDQWDSFFSDFVAFLHLTADRESSATRNVVEATLLKLDNYIRVLTAIRERLQASLAAGSPDPELQDIERDISCVLTNLRDIRKHWEDLDTEVSVCGLVAERQRSGGRGRPKVFISKEQIEFLRELRLSWTKIASLFGICRRTLYRIRSEYGLMDPYNFTHISDYELDRQVSSIKQLMPEAGQSMVKGALQGRGIHVSFSRVQDSMSRVDPVATALRWATPISRRTYSVSGPNVLWHMDGNHKLVRWRLVVHGAIDGFSRCIVFLHCSSNNKSATVLQLFCGAVQEYGLPHRIRCDLGGENIKVAEMMLLHSDHLTPVITGSSVHNQRIERLWRDVFRCVLTVFYQLFYYLERSVRPLI